MHGLTTVTAGDRNMTAVSDNPVQTAFPRGAAASDWAWQNDFVDIVPPHGAPDQTGPGNLTGRECTILQLLSHGLSNKEAAKRLGISPETVKSHVKNIFLKLSVERRAQAVSRGIGLGVIATNWNLV